MHRRLRVESESLPAGEYYCGFTVSDIFRCEHHTNLVKLHWDGETFTPAE